MPAIPTSTTPRKASATGRDERWLSQLVAPVPANAFVDTYWSARDLFCQGTPDRFAHLLSWDTLNEILEHHWREAYRFRLAVKGRDLDPATYADLDGYTPRVRAKDVTDFLRQGATLSFDAIDELHPPLTHLAESFESCFQGATKINIYAGWRAVHGLDLHRDNQEIFILQLDGRKRWALYGFSIDGVDTSRLQDQSLPPAGASFDRILEPGDLLYIPRGCYHLAVPTNAPTLHLTVGVKLPEGGEPAETVSNCKPRPSFSLPFSATAEGLPPHPDFLVRLNAPAPRIVDAATDGATLVVRRGTHDYRFPESMRMILAALADDAPTAFLTLAATVAADLDEDSVRFLLGMLVHQNLVAIRHA